MSIVRACLALIFAGFSAIMPAHALELGETYEQLMAKHGSATVEDRSRGLVSFTFGEWTADATVEKGVVRSILYRKLSPITDAEVPGIFDANGGRDAWKPGSMHNGKVGSWIRADGASASIDPKQPRYLTLRGGSGIYRAPGAAAKPAPQQSAPVPATPTVPPVKSMPPSPSPGSVPTPQSKTAHESASPPQSVPSPNPSPAEAKPSWALNKKTLISISVGFFVLVLIFVKIGPRLVLNHRATGTAAGGPKRPFRSLTKTVATSPGELAWEQFELLIAELFRRRGWQVEMERALGPDGGVDVRAFREGRRAIIQCKQRSTEKVGVAVVRELLGVMHAEQADEAWIFTTTSFTPDAIDFAAGQPVTLVDGPVLEASMRQIAVEGENLCNIAGWLPALQVHVHWREPVCPLCQGGMVVRRNTADHSVFWGCRTYPACKGTRDARKDLRTDAPSQAAA